MGHAADAVPTSNVFKSFSRDGHASKTLRSDAPHFHGQPDSINFSDFSNKIRRELSPATTLEDVLADRVILAAWRLHLLSLEESDLADLGAMLAPIGRETLRSECSLETALMLFENSRRLVAPCWGRAEHPVSKVVDEPETTSYPDDGLLSEADYSNEWATIPDTDSDTDSDPVLDQRDEEPTERIRWEDRLAFDENISDNSPVVKGTWVTVNHVVSLIIDGWNWSDVLRTHPELIEDDIRACLAYTVEQDGQGGF